eukprot:192209-Rhodomonas_salina.2
MGAPHIAVGFAAAVRFVAAHLLSEATRPARHSAPRLTHTHTHQLPRSRPLLAHARPYPQPPPAQSPRPRSGDGGPVCVQVRQRGRASRGIGAQARGCATWEIARPVPAELQRLERSFWQLDLAKDGGQKGVGQEVWLLDTCIRPRETRGRHERGGGRGARVEGEKGGRTSMSRGTISE